MIRNDQNGMRPLMTAQQRKAAVDDNRTQHVRLVFAIHRLEACLGQAAPGREQAWQDEVNAALDLLLVAMDESRDCVCRDDGLIEEIRVEKPFLANRIASLQAEFDGVVSQARALKRQLADADPNEQICVSDLRQRTSWLLTALRHHQAKEADLVYEAINVDIGVGD